MVSPETGSSNLQPSCEFKFKGVRKRKWGKWVSEIRLPNSRERIWLGSYDSPEKAARAFDAAQFCLRGRHANFNFPGSLPAIDRPHLLSPHQIQTAAAEFANERDSPPLARDGGGFRERGDLQAAAHNNGGNGLASSSSSSSFSAMSERMSANIYDGETKIDWSFLDALNANNDEGYTAFPQSPLVPEHTLQENVDACVDELFSHQQILWNFDS